MALAARVKAGYDSVVVVQRLAEGGCDRCGTFEFPRMLIEGLPSIRACAWCAEIYGSESNRIIGWLCDEEDVALIDFAIVEGQHFARGVMMPSDDLGRTVPSGEPS